MTKLRKNSLNINDTQIAGLYDLEHTIGKGHFAVVKLARHVFTGEKVAAKVIDKTRLDPISTAHMMQEIRCMKLVQHPNIIRLYEVIDTQTKLFLILELGDYDMYEWVIKRGYDKGGCKESDAQLYFSQIIKAINYCHKLHVVHRDLKPENVVFFEKLGMVKLTDFGFSNLFVPGQQLQTSCGSLAYSAPEILLGDAYDAPAVDVWSLGVILYMLVTGHLPFQESNDSETLTRILDCKFTFPEHISKECRNLISSMLVRDPKKRATLSEIVQNKWLRAGDRGHAEALPLIMRDDLPISAHTTIIEQMVAGNIGSEEEIHSAIERNEYNHLTATYYLLAERVLSCYRLAQANRLMQQQAAAAAREFSFDESFIGIDSTSQLISAATTTASSSSIGVSASSSRSRSRSNSWRGPAPRRAYSILKEESEEELSTYLRSPSRQSSRFYNIPPLSSAPKSRDTSSRTSLLAISRANSNESFVPGSSAILEDDIEAEEADAASSNWTGIQKQRGEQQQSSFDMPYPSATSTPFLQRLLAPIDENRDQSPDTLVGYLRNSNIATSVTSNNSNIFRFDQLQIQDDEEVDDALLLKQPLLNKPLLPTRTMQTSGSGTASQLPPLSIASPERQQFLIRRPLRNAASLELFPASAAKASTSSIRMEDSKDNGNMNSGFVNFTLLEQPCSSTSPSTPNPTTNHHSFLKTNSSKNIWNVTSMITSGVLERHPNYINLSKLPSTSNLVTRHQRKSSSSSLSRRNSSPSVSAMFHSASLHSSQDRISPHAIQELLEFSRLSGRRAASPDSRLSSRSPSPTCMSSGRVSPALSGFTASRIKANINGLFSSTGGGMRKLSSSPHLLGICEEIEELDSLVNIDGHDNYGNHFTNDSGVDHRTLPMTRSARSASMGLTTMSRLSFGGIGNASVNNNKNGSTPNGNIRKLSIQQQLK